MSANPEPPPLGTARPAAAARVTLGFILLGAVDLIWCIGSIIVALKERVPLRINLPVGCLALWLVAFLVWRNVRPIWFLLAYGSALGLGTMVGTAIGCALGLPSRLLIAALHAVPAYFAWMATYLLSYAVFCAWFFWESKRVHTITAGATLKWFRPAAFVGYSIVPATLLTWGMLGLLQSGWTEPVIKRARQEYGDDYDYIATNYRAEARGGERRHQALVLAYSDTEIRSIQLAWTD